MRGIVIVGEAFPTRKDADIVIIVGEKKADFITEELKLPRGLGNHHEVSLPTDDLANGKGERSPGQPTPGGH